MALTEEQRAELEAAGATSIRLKLTTQGEGRGASIMGFKCGEIARGDIQDWLDEKNQEEVALQRTILFWARVAGWTGIFGI